MNSHLFSWVAMTLCFLASGCYTVEEPPCPPIVIPENTGECSTLCKCDYDSFGGSPFRLTRLEIDEPEELATLLNTIWNTDILRNVVNVLFVVTDFEEGTAAAFNRITFKVGPGWRSPHEELSIPPADGDPSESMVDSYCMLEGYDVDMSVKPYHVHQCVFKTEEAGALYFHTGPLDNPIVCAPELEPPNSIPIQNLKVRLALNENCDGFTDGHLEGCIAVDEANKICMCLTTGQCPMEHVDMGDYESDDLAAYCKDKCGFKWISLGQSMAAFGLVPTCLTLDGREGYRVQGFIDGHSVPDYFNPIQSADCSVMQ